jgi:hypothetical protein
MMVLFGFIFFVSVAALLLVQSLDVECVNPPQRRKAVSAPAPSQVSYPAAAPAQHRELIAL